MISGVEFYNICNWNLCGRYPISFTKEKIKDNDTVFVNTDMVWGFIDFLKKNRIPKINVVFHNSDLSFTEEMFLHLKTYCNKIYAANCIVSDEMVVKIPLGFSDRMVNNISNVVPLDDKKNLLYLNFNIHSGRISERTECRSFFQNFEWVKFEDNISEDEYYKGLNLSKYSACPIGAGLDTHRFYESIYLNTVPIVKRNDISDLHLKFPCVIVDRWEDITEKYLIDSYDENLNNILKWKKENKWVSKYWIN